MSAGEGKAVTGIAERYAENLASLRVSGYVVSLIRKTRVLGGGWVMIATVWLCLGQTTRHTIVWF